MRSFCICTLALLSQTHSAAPDVEFSSCDDNEAKLLMASLLQHTRHGSLIAKKKNVTSLPAFQDSPNLYGEVAMQPSKQQGELVSYRNLRTKEGIIVGLNAVMSYSIDCDHLQHWPAAVTCDDTWNPGGWGWDPASRCAEWAMNSDWGALKDGETSLDGPCRTTWAKENCAHTCNCGQGFSCIGDARQQMLKSALSRELFKVVSSSDFESLYCDDFSNKTVQKRIKGAMAMQASRIEEAITVENIVLTTRPREFLMTSIADRARTEHQGGNASQVKVFYCSRRRILSSRTRSLTFNNYTVSKDSVIVDLELSVSYHLNPAMVNNVYRDAGSDFEKVLVFPEVNKHVDLAAASTDVGLLYCNHTFAGNAEAGIATSMQTLGVIVESFALHRVSLLPDLMEAIEAEAIAANSTEEIFPPKIDCHAEHRSCLIDCNVSAIDCHREFDPRGDGSAEVCEAVLGECMRTKCKYVVQACVKFNEQNTKEHNLFKFYCTKWKNSQTGTEAKRDTSRHATLLSASDGMNLNSLISNPNLELSPIEIFEGKGMLHGTMPAHKSVEGNDLRP